jgi:hypothetical protein
MLVVCHLCIVLGLYRVPASYPVQAVYLFLSALLVIVIYKVKPQPKIIMLGSSLSLVSALILDTAMD